MAGLGRKLSFLLAVAVIATATLGAAHTLWYEDLDLHTQVQTGTLDATIVCGVPGDNENPAWPSPPGLAQPFASYPKADPLKDVASPITVEATSQYIYSLSVENAYPGYMLNCEYHGQNLGSVAVHVEQILIRVTRQQEGEADVDLGFGVCEGNFCRYGDRGVNPPNPGDEWSEVWAQVANDEGCQLHTEEEVNGSFFVGINQPAHEEVTYLIEVIFQLNQWNESGWWGCGDPKQDPVQPVLPNGV